MQLKIIKVSEAKPSPTNTKGRTEGEAFADLVASIKEKGILQPILVRKITGTDRAEEYEVIAGNRRLAAAKKAGLETIPANIVQMDDIEAREAQIVENLQRENLHPLDEGEAYRKLAEVSKYEVPTIAAKVGKSDSYVRQRLFLTNLEPKMREAYRAGKMTDGHAVLIAKLGAADQLKAFKAATDRWSPMSVAELKKWIEEHIYSELRFQPWLKDEEATAAVGECQECEPNRASLFGEVKEGACTDTKCWNRKVQKYISWKAKKENAVKIKTEYGHEKEKGVLTRDEYTVIQKPKKDGCDHMRNAVVAIGNGLGTVHTVCTSKDCEKHGTSRSAYRRTPEERAKRKQELIEAGKKKLKEDQEMNEALEKVKWPLTEKQLDVLYEAAFDHCGFTEYEIVAKRHGLKGREQKDAYSKDYETPIREVAEKDGTLGKLRMIFELLTANKWADERKKMMKNL